MKVIVKRVYDAPDFLKYMDKINIKIGSTVRVLNKDEFNKAILLE